MVPTMSVPQDYGTKRCSALQVSDDGPAVARRVSADLGEEKSLLIPWHLGGSGHTELWLEHHPPEIKWTLS